MYNRHSKKSLRFNENSNGSESTSNSFHLDEQYSCKDIIDLVVKYWGCACFDENTPRLIKNNNNYHRSINNLYDQDENIEKQMAQDNESTGIPKGKKSYKRDEDKLKTKKSKGKQRESNNVRVTASSSSNTLDESTSNPKGKKPKKKDQDTKRRKSKDKHNDDNSVDIKATHSTSSSITLDDNQRINKSRDKDKYQKNHLKEKGPEKSEKIISHTNSQKVDGKVTPKKQPVKQKSVEGDKDRCYEVHTRDSDESYFDHELYTNNHYINTICGPSEHSEYATCSGRYQPPLHIPTSCSIQTCPVDTSDFCQNTRVHEENLSNCSFRILLGPSLDETGLMIVQNLQLFQECFCLLQRCYADMSVRIIPILRCMFNSSNNFVKVIIITIGILSLLSPLVTVTMTTTEVY